uniref:kelch-like protein 29 n=1 Tax=Myxine glutinosa TaxID=7769 RepID=UPI00358F712E
MTGALTPGAVPNFFSPIIPPPQTPPPPSFMPTSYQPSFQQPIVPVPTNVSFNGGPHTLEYNLSKTGTYQGVPGQMEGVSAPTSATSSLSCLKDRQLKVVSLGQYVFADTAHAGEVLRGLNEQRISKEFTDLRIIVRGRSFEAHRNVVASNNLYFKELIKRSLQPQSSVGQNEVLKVVVTDMSAEAMEMLLDFIYTGLLSAKSCSAEALLEVTAKLKMEDFDQLCDSILGRELSAQSCLSIQIMAEALGCQELAERARSFALQHFQDVAAAGELKHLGKIELLAYLSSDELNACREEVVYEAAMAWLRQDPANRLQYAAEILGTVRLPFIHPSYLFNVVDGDHMVRSSEECRDLVNEAKRYHMLPHDRNGMHSTRTRPRHVAGFTEVIVLVGGRHTEGEGQQALNTVCCFNPETSKWYPMAALPFCEREFFSIVSFADNIYITGGMEGGNVKADIWCYMSSLDSWNQVSRMAVPRCRHSSLVLGTHIYALGGRGGPGNLSHVERFDIVSSHCEALAPLPKPVHSAAVVAGNNKIFMFGGVNEAGRSASVIQSYTPLSNEWSFIETPMIDNKFVPAVILDSLIYILGGPFARAITIFDPKKENIKTGPNMMCNRLYSSAAVVGGKIYVVGGLSNLDGHALSSMDVYDPVESRWTLMHNLPCPVYRHGCTVIKKHLSI